MNKVERERYIAWLGHATNDINIWGQYERLVDFIITEFPKTGRRFDEISLPTLFTISHTIELALKENIKFFQEYHESNHLTKFDNWTLLIKSHDLEKLSSEFKIGYFRLHKKVKADKESKIEFVKYFAELDKLIKILQRNTETYRYSLKIDNDGKVLKKSIDEKKKVDFFILKELFDKVKTLFIGAPNSLGIYTDYMDFKKNNPDYKKGKGRLYCQKLHYTEHFLESVKAWLNEQLTQIGNDAWMDKRNGDMYDIQIWENDIYIILI